MTGTGWVLRPTGDLEQADGEVQCRSLPTSVMMVANQVGKARQHMIKPVLVTKNPYSNMFSAISCKRQETDPKNISS
jgi:hypothetical protein